MSTVNKGIRVVGKPKANFEDFDLTKFTSCVWVETTKYKGYMVSNNKIARMVSAEEAGFLQDQETSGRKYLIGDDGEVAAIGALATLNLDEEYHRTKGVLSGL